MAKVTKKLEHCPDCYVKINERHHKGCDIERCTVCGGQRLVCGCKGHKPWSAVWTGFWPGVIECQVLGWYSKFIPNYGWRQTTQDDPDGMEDLNRWVIYNMEVHQLTNLS